MKMQWNFQLIFQPVTANIRLFAEEKSALICYYVTSECAVLQTMPFRFSEIPLLVSPVVCRIQVAAKLNSSKASAKLITVIASYLAKAQYSRRVLKFLWEFTVSSALIPNLIQVWLNYLSKTYTLPGLTRVCLSLKEIGPSKKYIILSSV